MGSTRTVTTQPSPATEIDYFFDIGGESIFAPTALGAQDQGTRGPFEFFAEGGFVDESNDDFDRILRLLRGT
jgi:hypothetical protein